MKNTRKEGKDRKEGEEEKVKEGKAYWEQKMCANIF